MDKAAEAAGAQRASTDVWEVELEDGVNYAVAKDARSWQVVKEARPTPSRAKRSSELGTRVRSTRGRLDFAPNFGDGTRVRSVPQVVAAIGVECSNLLCSRPTRHRLDARQTVLTLCGARDLVLETRLRLKASHPADPVREIACQTASGVASW